MSINENDDVELTSYTSESTAAAEAPVASERPALTVPGSAVGRRKEAVARVRLVPARPHRVRARLRRPHVPLYQRPPPRLVLVGARTEHVVRQHTEPRIHRLHERLRRRGHRRHTVPRILRLQRLGGAHVHNDARTPQLRVCRGRLCVVERAGRRRQHGIDVRSSDAGGRCRGAHRARDVQEGRGALGHMFLRQRATRTTKTPRTAPGEAQCTT